MRNENTGQQTETPYDHFCRCGPFCSHVRFASAARTDAGFARSTLQTRPVAFFGRRRRSDPRATSLRGWLSASA